MGYGINGLSFRELREANRERLLRWRDTDGNLIYSDKDGSDWSVERWFMALVGEVGEFGNLYKKVLRGDFSESGARRDLEDELADVMCYLDLLANRLGIDLGEVTMRKWNEVSDKRGHNMRLDVEGWHNTVAPNETQTLLDLLTPEQAKAPKKMKGKDNGE